METRIDAQVPPVVVVEIEETEAEREEREKKEEAERNSRRYALVRQIDGYFEQMSVCLDMILDTPADDRTLLAALALRLRSLYLAALELIPEHKSLGGSYYEITMRPFQNLYR